MTMIWATVMIMMVITPCRSSPDNAKQLVAMGGALALARIFRQIVAKQSDESRLVLEILALISTQSPSSSMLMLLMVLWDYI